MLDRIKSEHKSFVTMDDGEPIAVWDSGGVKPCVVLIHGFPENHLSWNGLLDCLLKDTEPQYRLILYDLRGHGESSKNGEASWQRFVQDHITIMESLNISRYHLVGHDWGGAIGLHISRLFPDKLMTLSILNTNFWKTDFKGMWHLSFLNMPIICPLAFRFYPEKIYELFLEKSFLNPSSVEKDIRKSYLHAFRDRATTSYWIKLYKGMAKSLLAQASPKVLKKHIEFTKTSLPKSSVNHFKVPTRMIWGKQDTFNPLWVGRDIEKRLKQMEVEVDFFEINRAGHFVAEEQPQAVAKLLREHWTSVSKKVNPA